MYVARILYPVEVLGPGRRVGIWFCGCHRRCKGCSNPELWEFQDRYRTTPQFVYHMILEIAKKHTIEGFTLTGGEPMLQPDDLQHFISLIRNISNDILVYTGYLLEELEPKKLQNISVLIDGEYIASRNTNCVLRGSDNQRIHVLDPELEKKYNTYLSQNTNQIQNFMTNDGVISVGIHKPGFMQDLHRAVAERGLQKHK